MKPILSLTEFKTLHYIKLETAENKRFIWQHGAERNKTSMFISTSAVKYDTIHYMIFNLT